MGNYSRDFVIMGGALSKAQHGVSDAFDDAKEGFGTFDLMKAAMKVFNIRQDAYMSAKNMMNDQFDDGEEPATKSKTKRKAKKSDKRMTDSADMSRDEKWMWTLKGILLQRREEVRKEFPNWIMGASMAIGVGGLFIFQLYKRHYKDLSLGL